MYFIIIEINKFLPDGFVWALSVENGPTPAHVRAATATDSDLEKKI